MNNYAIENRIRRNISFAKNLKDLKGVDRKAARLLFSVLADLETIAVKAAERGDSVEGQLEDEIVHHKTFTVIAEVLGGKEPTPESVIKTLDFLENLKGRMSLVLLNVTAESWLEKCLHRLGQLGICDDVFAIIEADEHRHAEHAKQLDIPDPRITAPIMNKLEKLLVGLVTEPMITLPIMHFGGVNEASKMGLDIAKAHRDACKHLKIEPSEHISDMEDALKQALTVKDPIKKVLTKGESVFADGLFPEQFAVMWEPFEIPWTGDKDYKEIELALCNALSAMLDRFPQYNITLNNGEVYQCFDSVVGMRRVDEYGQVFTIYLKNPHTLSEDKNRKVMKRQVSSIATRRPYCSKEEWAVYQDLSPINRSAAVITHVGALGIHDGSAPIPPREGSPIVLMTTKLKKVPKPFMKYFVKWENVVRLCIHVDHRVFHPREIVKMTDYITEWMMKWQEGLLDGNETD